MKLYKREKYLSRMRAFFHDDDLIKVITGIHIIPRKINDGIDAWPVFDGAKQDMEFIWEQIKTE